MNEDVCQCDGCHYSNLCYGGYGGNGQYCMLDKDRYIQELENKLKER